MSMRDIYAAAMESTVQVIAWLVVVCIGAVALAALVAGLGLLHRALLWTFGGAS